MKTVQKGQDQPGKDNKELEHAQKQIEHAIKRRQKRLTFRQGINTMFENLGKGILSFFFGENETEINQACQVAGKLRKTTAGALNVRPILTTEGAQVIAWIGPVYLHTDHLGILIKTHPGNQWCNKVPHEDTELLKKIQAQLSREEEEEEEEDLKLRALQNHPRAWRDIHSFFPSSGIYFIDHVIYFGLVIMGLFFLQIITRKEIPDHIIIGLIVLPFITRILDVIKKLIQKRRQAKLYENHSHL